MKLWPVSDLLALARSVGQEATELVRRQRPPGRVDVADTKSSPTDIVTAIDRDSETLIRERILAARPADGFIGEEGEDLASESGVTWVVDPIDGTVNFVYGIPSYAVSIAARTDDGVLVGYVINIATGEEFGAIAGEGAWQWLSADDDASRRALVTPAASSLSELLVATGFNYRSEVRALQIRAVGLMLPQVRDIRRMGAAALDLVAVARGQVDAYVEQGLKPWDLAAGGLIAAEAGAVVAGLDGPPGERLVMASHPSIAEEYFALVRACGF